MWKLIYFLTAAGIHAVLTDRVSGHPGAGLIDLDAETDEDLKNVIITAHGRVRGFEKDGILQFFDIPYGAFTAARPFREPTEPASWTVIREVEEHRSRCPQIEPATKTFLGHHDCLTLSIFKSSNDDVARDKGNAEQADVLFHIHDSSFASGSGDPLVYGPKYLVPKGVILVLPNYRLGPLGFLCLQNETAPGNAALKDLTLALNWTVRNIEAFGGNPSNIAVSGAGAGGALVEYLILSNMSRTYFSKAITESGFSTSPWAMDRHPLIIANTLLENIAKAEDNGDRTNGFKVFDDIDLEVLIRAGTELNFRPCIENEGFITETPWQLLLQNQSLQLTYMSGSANQAAMKKALGHTEESLALLNSDWSLLLPNDLVFTDNEDKARTGKQIKTLYFGEKNITLADINQLSQCYTDSEYLNSGIRAARLLVRGGATVYFYEFAFNITSSERDFYGSVRGDSLAFVFSKSEQTAEHEQDDRMKNIMTNLWVNFIKTGNPSTENVVWNNTREVAAAEEEWLAIGSVVRMEKGLHLDRLSLWQEIYARYFIENNPGFVHKPSVYVLVSSLSVLTRLTTARTSVE